MIRSIIVYCSRHPGLVICSAAVAAVGAYLAISNITIDAIPDLSDTQVIIWTEWMGRSPDQIEDQITYPIVASLLSAPRVSAVRGFSMFGMSFVYVIFQDGTNIYWARSRVLEYLKQLEGKLPAGVTPLLGPDATSVGWIYQYALVDTSGQHDLAELRAFQDFTLRYALASVPGVAEVASIGGYQKQYQVEIDPRVLQAYGLTLGEVITAIRNSNSDVGGRVIEMSGREYVVRGRGYIKGLDDLRQVTCGVSSSGVPIMLGQVARVSLGPDIRRGLGELDGQGEAVGAIVIMRHGENALEVIKRVKARLTELASSFPSGVIVKPVYDRSGLIQRAISTLKHTLFEEGIVVALVIIIFLLHFRSALVPIVALPLSVGLAFIPMYFLKINSNIMSLGGIAIAIGAMVDASIVLVENAHKRLENAGTKDYRAVITAAAAEVGPPIFYSLLIITVAFLPIFTLTGQSGRLFGPLAYTKTFAMLFAAITAVTIVPALMPLLITGKVKPETKHPVSQFIIRFYRPFVYVALHNPKSTLAIGLVAVLATLPVVGRIGSEFMPPLNESDILYMPTTLPNISIEEAKQYLQYQDRVLRSFPEVVSVYGKAGRAETATDPAPLSMVETVVQLKPRDQWRTIEHKRWYSGRAPSFLKPLLGTIWPERKRLTWQQLVAEFDQAMQFPGWTNAWTMPIKARIDMLSTGIRTPIGIKIFGQDLQQIEQIGMQLEKVLGEVPGTRSVYSERNTGGYYIDIIPNRRALARYGLTVGDVNQAIEVAIGGMPIEATIEGRARFSINVRYPRELRQSVERIKEVLVSVSRSGGQPGGVTDDMAMALSAERAQTQWYVPLGLLAEVKVVQGPPMIKDEDGSLVGYVFIDIDQSQRDIGGYVADAKNAVREKIALPAGYHLKWTGQYELLQQMLRRMKVIVPLTVLLVIILLYLNFRNLTETFIVLLSVPFAMVGSFWLMYILGHNFSTATWVGIIALIGLAAETGVVMVVYLDHAFHERLAAGKMADADDVLAATMDGAVQRVRPKLMTVGTTMIGLLPLLWATGTGADLMKRVAAPMVGGLVTSAFLTLEIIPVVYAYWRKRQLKSGRLLFR